MGRVASAGRRHAGNPASERFVSRARHKDGRTILIEIHGTRTIYKGRYAMAGIGIEATERIHNEEELQRSRAQLQQLTAYTTAKLEEQRLVFARDLEGFTRRSGMAHGLDAQRASTLRLPPKRATAIYRIFHEALTNVARHSGASRVDVVLSIEQECFVLELCDDGGGFDLSAARDRSLGLLHMSERAREIGGDLRIASSAGAGTRLVLSVPLL